MKRIVIALAALLAAASAFAQTEFSKESFKASNGETLLYRSIAPENMNPKKEYPLVIFLHGAGERGNDNEKQLFHGSQQWLNPVNRAKYPAFVIFPQCPEGRYWTYDIRPGSFDVKSMPAGAPMSSTGVALKELIDKYLNMPGVDRDRVYIMGLSMGGMATFDMVIRYPEIFAAAVPICGAVNVERLGAAVDVPFSIYHGDKDPTVPVECSRGAYRALKSAGADVRYKEFVGCGHGSWDPAFNEPDFMSWLFKQKK